MGFYYDRDSSPSQDEEKPPGCLDALLITRAVLGIIMIPMVVLLGLFLDLGLTIWLFSIHPALALVPVVLTGLGIWMYSRWEQKRFRPPEI